MRLPDQPEPFVRISKSGDSWTCSGRTRCELGHRIPGGAGDADDGVYAGWHWDGSTLDAYNDRYGFLPLFYYERGTEIAVSTSILKLLELGGAAELDYEALSVFLRLGCFLSTDTAFRGIRALPPNARFRWQAGRLSLEDGLRLVPPRSAARAPALDDYIALFRRAIERRAPAGRPFAVLLSGGRDSRHILFELCAAGHRPTTCITARYFPPGNTGDGEIAVAAQVAGALGVPHEVVDQNGPMHEAERRNNALTNFSAGDSAWMLAVADRLRGKAELVYDGIAGDVLSAGLFLTAERLAHFRAGRLRALGEDLLGREHGERMFSPAVRAQLARPVALARLMRELERHRSAANPVGSFIFWNRTRRHIASSGYRILEQVSTVLSPYLDHQVFDLLSALPAELFLDHGFHTEAIARAFPRFAGIGYAAKADTPPSPAHRAAMRRFALDTLTAAAAHGRSALVRRSFFVPRLLRCLVDPRYSASISWLGPLMTYGLQLEDAARLRHGAI